jgi:hypothetical protein
MARVFIQNPTRYNLTIGNRGAMRLPPQAAGMTYHHIIPYNELRDFWNTAVANDLEQIRETIVPQLIRSMPEYPLDQANPQRAQALVGSASGLLQMIWAGNYVHAPAPAPAPAGIDDFNAVYTWMPGNLFAGPTVRANDPEDQFDSFAHRVVPEGRYLIVLAAHRAIELYLGLRQPNAYTPNAAGTRARAQDARLAHDAGLALARVATVTDPTPYDPTRW